MPDLREGVLAVARVAAAGERHYAVGKDIDLAAHRIGAGERRGLEHAGTAVANLRAVVQSGRARAVAPAAAAPNDRLASDSDPVIAVRPHADITAHAEAACA